jgi:hypothetical protein
MLPNQTALPVSRFAILIIAAFISYAPLSFAQEATTTQAPPMYRGVQTHVDGVFVTPVPNEPLTAVAEVESTQTLDDGTPVSKKTFNNIARDSQGRIYNERRSMVPATSNATPELMSFHVFDPTTRLNTFLDPETHLARQSFFPERATTQPVSRAPGPSTVVAVRKQSGVEEQDLGTQSMEGVVVRGTRKIRTISASSSGTGKAVVVTDEIWYSEELSLNMLVKHDDPRTGQQTVTITKVERSEPPAETFEIPAGYRVVDETPVSR